MPNNQPSDQAPEGAAHTPTTPVIQCEHLDVTLDGHQILFDVDARVQAGETVALLGANGSGKTTLVKALLGLIGHSGGKVELFGTQLSHFKHWNRLGYVPQRGHSQVANATVREVVSTGRLANRRIFSHLNKADRLAVNTALERVELTERADDPLSVLSGGQQQRALIARALASQAELLILDEPLAALDIPTQESLARLFGRLKDEGLSMLVILHELGPMETLIDRSIMIQLGRKIYDGPLLAGPPIDSGHHHPERLRKRARVMTNTAMCRPDIDKEA